MNDPLCAAVKAAYINTGLEEGIGLVHKFLTSAYLYEGVSVRKMATRLLLPVPVTAALKNELKKYGLVKVKNGICLSDKGERFVREYLGYQTIDREALLGIDQSPWDDLSMFTCEIGALKGIYENRPEADVTLDQALCTAETGMRRALLMLRSGGLIGKKVLFVGDDDLTSIALSFVLKRISNPCPQAGQTGYRASSPEAAGAADITVFDIDERVLRYIADISEKLDIRVHCLMHDLRVGLPAVHQGCYDSVFTDPPYTLEGLKLFISRGASALKNESDLFLYLAFGHKSPLVQLAVQKQLLESGFIISQIYQQFNRYCGAQILGGVSDTMVLNTTARTKESIRGDYGGLLYTNELNRSIRMYECKNCRSRYRVGHGERFVTIERLKEKGCPNCGQFSFRLIEKKGADV